MSSNAQWLLNRDALADAFRLVLVELWGHGRSPAPAEIGDYSVARYLEELERIRESLDIERRPNAAGYPLVLLPTPSSSDAVLGGFHSVRLDVWWLGTGITVVYSRFP